MPGERSGPSMQGAAMRSALSSKSAPIKAVLLDQSAVVCGIGNWVADEVLYMSRIHPATAASALSAPFNALSAPCSAFSSACSVFDIGKASIPETAHALAAPNEQMPTKEPWTLIAD